MRLEEIEAVVQIPKESIWDSLAHVVTHTLVEGWVRHQSILHSKISNDIIYLSVLHTFKLTDIRMHENARPADEHWCNWILHISCPSSNWYLVWNIPFIMRMLMVTSKHTTCQKTYWNRGSLRRSKKIFIQRNNSQRWSHAHVLMIRNRDRSC